MRGSHTSGKHRSQTTIQTAVTTDRITYLNFHDKRIVHPGRIAHSTTVSIGYRNFIRRITGSQSRQWIIR